MEKTIKQGLCSYYVSNKAKDNTEVSIAQFITAIRSDRWKEKAEEFRRLMAQGDKRGAKYVKDFLPCLIVAGVCRGGHSKANFVSFSGYLMIDIDHYKDDIRALLELLKAQPWSYAGWITVSGEGMKLVVRVDAVTQDEYEKMAYPLVAAHIRRLIGFPVDMQCSDLTRTCYASYDADAFCKEEGCEVYPWREEAEASGFTPETPDTGGEKQAPKESVQSTAQGMVHAFFDAFIESFPYVPNHRHQFHLALGREARRFGMNEEELKQLAELAVLKLAMPDSDGPEIRYNILNAYEFGEKKGMGEGHLQGFRRFWGHRVPKMAFDADEMKDESDVAETNRELRMSAPCLPDWIFDLLPEMFRQGLVVAKNPRQRDMLFLSMMANYSGCMPGVRMVYDDADIYPHLFLDVIGSSAVGKGIMAYAARLPRSIQKLLDEEDEQRNREYEKATLLWEQERQRANKERREPDMKLRPEPVLRKTLMVAADVSRTRLIQLMSGSPGGVILNVSEMDTLMTAINAEYGRFDDLMRACFHHEMFGSDFKQDKRQYMVYCPKMVFCASGTPSQFYRLCPSPENGAYSRHLIYMAEQDADFRLMAPGDERKNKDKVFRELSERTLEMYRFLKANPTEVKFTPGQWDYHRAYFQDMLQGVVMEETDAPVSVVFRHGLSTARLAMVLTAMRKFEEQWSFYEMKCSEDDFRIVMAIMEVLLRHSLTLSTALRKEQASPAEMYRYFGVRRALEKLNPEFRYNELMEALVSEGMSQSSAKRARIRLLKMQIIVKEGDKYKFVHRKWRGILDKEEGEMGTR